MPDFPDIDGDDGRYWALDPTANEDESEVAHAFDAAGVSACERFVLPGDPITPEFVGTDVAACDLCLEIVGWPDRRQRDERR
jgi:hypothetical protein